jgi:hypothetical protein
MQGLNFSISYLFNKQFKLATSLVAVALEMQKDAHHAIQDLSCEFWISEQILASRMMFASASQDQDSSSASIK